MAAFKEVGAAPSHERFNWPPLFTEQTREKTRVGWLNIWRDIILQWHMENKVSVLRLSEWPHFENAKINRKMRPEARRTVLDYLASVGNGEWVEGSENEFVVFYKTPAQWAEMLYSWADRSMKCGDILTIYDITSGDETTEEEFYNLDSRTLVRSLAHLQGIGRARIMREEGRPIDEWGVKFLQR